MIKILTYLLMCRLINDVGDNYKYTSITTKNPPYYTPGRSQGGEEL
jgi:hypothetical protein